MVDTNYKFNDQKVADYIEKKYDEEDAVELATSVMFDAPISNGLPMAEVTITRTYRVPAPEARQALNDSF